MYAVKKSNAIKPCIRLEAGADFLSAAGNALKSSLERISSLIPAKERSALKLIASTLPLTSKEVQTSARSLSPIGGEIKWVYNRTERDRKRKAVDSKTSYALEKVKQYNSKLLSEIRNSGGSAPVRSSSGRPKKKRKIEAEEEKPYFCSS
jgi:hypothetical protein